MILRNFINAFLLIICLLTVVHLYWHLLHNHTLQTLLCQKIILILSVNLRVLLRMECFIFCSFGRRRYWRIYPEWRVHGVNIPQDLTLWWSYIGIHRISDSCGACQFFFPATEKGFNIRGNIQTHIQCK